MDQKLINNAMSAYFGLGILLLLPSKNQSINHPFVKRHAITALFIHGLLIITYLIFITYGFLGKIVIFWFHLNHILALGIFLWLFWWILYGVYQAHLWGEFAIEDMKNITKTKNLITLKESQLNEQGKLTLILALIPFLWFTLRGKFYNYKSPIIENNIKINVLFTLWVIFIFMTGYEDIGYLLLLGYFIFIWFYALLIIIKENILTFWVQKVPSFEMIYLYTKTFFQYIKRYFSERKFVWFQTLFEEQKHIFLDKQAQRMLLSQEQRDSKLPFFLIYIPYINLISIYDIKSKYKFHIINGLTITFLSILLFTLWWNRVQIFLLFLMCFGFGYQKNTAYVFPILYDIYEVGEKWFHKIFSWGKQFYKLQTSSQEVTFEVESSLKQPASTHDETSSSLDNFKEK